MKKLSHFDEQGKIKMVDVSAKETTVRRAVASVKVLLSEETIKILKASENPKGNPLEIAVTTLSTDTSDADAAFLRDAQVPINMSVFGTKLDDEIVGTAGRLADAATGPGEPVPQLRIVYVIEVPLTVPLTSPPPKERAEVASAAVERAQQVASEYETVEAQQTVKKARNVGAGIVEVAREFGAQMIVMGAEPPTRIRGGAILGGVGGARPAEIGPVTEYVLRRAPCRVLVTAPVDVAADDGAGGSGELEPVVPAAE